MNTIQLLWPTFTVDVSVVHAYFKANLSSNYDGLVCDPKFLNVIFKTDYVQADSDAVNNYWNSITAQMFQPTPMETVSLAIGEAMQFGTQLLVQFATQNVIAGITQSGKTQAVMDYCHELAHCLITGSLYAAINQLNVMIQDTGSTKTALSPFITNTVLYDFLNKIQTYLQIPLTQNPGT